jgi:CheY-like chemotaxis protein
LLRSVVAEKGLRSDEAENGQQGLDLIENAGFDFLLMDRQMQVLDGLAATRMLRERGLTVPIVALTSDCSRASESRGAMSALSSTTGLGPRSDIRDRPVS